MSPTLFRLILLVSCAHGLVHVYEQSFPSVEQKVAKEFQVDTRTTGVLGTCFRLPFGLFAILVGWLTDRWGTKRMLVAYLFGCAGVSCAIIGVTDLSGMYVAMLLLGMFASIYHPAGLSLISHKTTIANRSRALGLHGIFGSAGIGGAPFLAGTVLSLGVSWRQYYLLLAIPGFLLGLWFLLRLNDGHRPDAIEKTGASTAEEADAVDEARWKCFFLLTVLGSLAGFIYAAFLTFLPRYMDGAGLSLGSIPAEGVRNYLTGGVLLLGMIGQYTAGRLARPRKLEWMLAGVMFASAPFLAWMAVAQGHSRLWAAGGFALIHFMSQPVFNSLVANYSSARRRSLCYGFSFLMSFGLGSFGAAFAGYAATDAITYGTLAVVATLAGLIGLVLKVWNRPVPAA